MSSPLSQGEPGHGLSVGFQLAPRTVVLGPDAHARPNPVRLELRVDARGRFGTRLHPVAVCVRAKSALAGRCINRRPPRGPRKIGRSSLTEPCLCWSSPAAA